MQHQYSLAQSLPWVLAFALGVVVGESVKTIPAMEQLAPHGTVHGRFGPFRNFQVGSIELESKMALVLEICHDTGFTSAAAQHSASIGIALLWFSSVDCADVVAAL